MSAPLRSIWRGKHFMGSGRRISWSCDQRDMHFLDVSKGEGGSRMGASSPARSEVGPGALGSGRRHCTEGGATQNAIHVTKRGSLTMSTRSRLEELRFQAGVLKNCSPMAVQVHARRAAEFPSAPTAKEPGDSLVTVTGRHRHSGGAHEEPGTDLRVLSKQGGRRGAGATKEEGTGLPEWDAVTTLRRICGEWGEIGMWIGEYPPARESKRFGFSVPGPAGARRRLVASPERR